MIERGGSALSGVQSPNIAFRRSAVLVTEILLNGEQRDTRIIELAGVASA